MALDLILSSEDQLVGQTVPNLRFEYPYRTLSHNETEPIQYVV
jgi:hypothetical protein